MIRTQNSIFILWTFLQMSKFLCNDLKFLGWGQMRQMPLPSLRAWTWLTKPCFGKLLKTRHEKAWNKVWDPWTACQVHWMSLHPHTINQTWNTQQVVNKRSTKSTKLLVSFFPISAEKTTVLIRHHCEIWPVVFAFRFLFAE